MSTTEERTRTLERQAVTGDTDAAKALERQLLRAGSDKAEIRRVRELAGFDHSFADFMVGVQRVIDEHAQKAYDSAIKRGRSPKGADISRQIHRGGALTFTRGRRYMKVFHGGGVHCFVDMTNGDILKAASRKAPAKHARGNIYEIGADVDGNMTPYGARYLR